MFADPKRGRQREMGLGPAAGASRAGIALANARRAAEGCRAQLYSGVDPIEARQAAAGSGKLFGEYADEWITDKIEGTVGADALRHWKSSMKTHAAPLRPLPVADITSDDVLRCLKPLFAGKPKTGRKVAGRIKQILDTAKVQKLRSGENPAAWEGNLAAELGKKKAPVTVHRVAMSRDEAPQFIRDLRACDLQAALALEFTILTAVRTNETHDAVWSEFDLAKRLWTIPAERMKMKLEHIVPLSDAALAVLEKCKGVHPTRVFNGNEGQRPADYRHAQVGPQHEARDRRDGTRFSVRVCRLGGRGNEP
jgi:integrase